jgi:hypothetical protein
MIMALFNGSLFHINLPVDVQTKRRSDNNRKIRGDHSVKHCSAINSQQVNFCRSNGLLLRVIRITTVACAANRFFHPMLQITGGLQR